MEKVNILGRFTLLMEGFAYQSRFIRSGAPVRRVYR